MASSQPIVKQISWFSLIPQMGLLVVLMAILIQGLEAEWAIFYAATIYLLISICLRIFVPYDHRKGIVAFKKMDYEKAIFHFEKSYKFFNQHRLMDKWRYLTLLSSSRISYREMALLNMAFCLGQLKRGAESKSVYEKVLSEFPDSQIALSSLNLFEAISESRE